MKENHNPVWFFQSSSSDPFYNLAMERYFMEDLPKSRPLIFVYRNRPSVIIGKNQNPWVETSPNFLAKKGIDLVRRLTGGGAVYHDLGNINFSLILPRKAANKDVLFEFIKYILEDFNLNQTEIRGNSLYYHNRKISGSAYYYKKERAMLHCTLLVKTDLSVLSQSLKPESDLKINSRAVNSIRANVANCCDFIQNISPEKIIQRTITRLLSSNFIEKKIEILPIRLQAKKIESYKNELLTWEWVFGQTPDFECYINWKNIDPSINFEPLYLKMKYGKIEKLKINKREIHNIKEYKDLINLQKLFLIKPD